MTTQSPPPATPVRYLTLDMHIVWQDVDMLRSGFVAKIYRDDHYRPFRVDLVCAQTHYSRAVQCDDHGGNIHIVGE